MHEWLYVMFIQRGKTYNKITKEVITRHAENLRALDEAGKIELAGAFKGYPGVAGMVVFKTGTREEAEELCKQEPLVAEGYAAYTLRDMRPANRDNNYLL
ncbi:YciI family protein [Breznakiella homolactica]|uniref:YCII-related domain-containing protein n=1 Tax=Breznakiella homolactica TaxID=2798577 RepID=A0A7T7XKG3_9SPIR|nr:YciI family protein [Breznakiella homolactica]QQO07843.1 YciI family protein [Breznakiella homolactica]